MKWGGKSSSEWLRDLYWSRADAPGPSEPAPRHVAMAARHVATLDVLLKEMLTERSTAAAAAPFTVADVMARLARANLSFPEDAVVQVCTHVTRSWAALSWPLFWAADHAVGNHTGTLE